MSTAGLPSDDDPSRPRVPGRTWRIVWLAALAAVALAMIVEGLRTGRIRAFWTLVVLVLLLPYFWQTLREGRRQRPAPTAHPAKLRRRSGRGQKPMIWPVGGVLVLFAIVNQVTATAARGSLWRVFLAIVVFLYLWWLSSLLFDLLFIWHRYIQGDAAHRFLREQVQRRDFSVENDPPEEPPPPSPATIPPTAPGGAPSTGMTFEVYHPIKLRREEPEYH